jgi:hypothetical protein
MGDRGMIHFKEFDRTEAAVYTHYYGSSVDEVMAEFFEANEAASGSDTRYDDATYLAARFVAHVMKGDPYGLGWGIIRPGTAEGPTWTVDCDNREGPQGRPRVSKEV